MTHLLNLCKKTCEYGMDRASIVEEQSRDDSANRQTDRWTDGQTNGQGETSIPPFNFIEAGGIINYQVFYCIIKI